MKVNPALIGDNPGGVSPVETHSGPQSGVINSEVTLPPSDGVCVCVCVCVCYPSYISVTLLTAGEAMHVKPSRYKHWIVSHSFITLGDYWWVRVPQLGE